MRRLWVLAAGFALGGLFLSLGSHSGKASDDLGWRSFYVGVNAGRADRHFDRAFTSPAVPSGRFVTLEDTKGIFGGHIGAQTEWRHIIFGVEVAYSDSNNDWARTPGYGANVITDTLARIGSIVTIGPRIGWAPNDSWLVFATGGYASAAVRSAAFSLTTNTVLKEVEKRHAGGFVGGGIERALGSNLVLGIEYQHLQFEKKLHSCAGVATCKEFDDRLVDAETDIVRARLSFRFGHRDEDQQGLSGPGS